MSEAVIHTREAKPGDRVLALVTWADAWDHGRKVPWPTHQETPVTPWIIEGAHPGHLYGCTDDGEPVYLRIPSDQFETIIVERAS